MTEKTAEARRWDDTKQMFESEPLTLGPYFTFIVRKTPRRLLHLLSYYKFAAKMIGADKRVLEVGCSEGLGSVLLAEFAREVVAIDFDGPAIAAAKATVGSEKLHFVEGDIMTADLGTFDAAVSLDVIEHIYQENEATFLGRIAEMLGPHGVCLIGTPNITSDVYASPHSRAGHVNLFSAERLRALMETQFHNVFMFGANDEIVHTGFAPMSYYLLALGVGPKR